jgi:uncharacterized paraquat-inducible protein A
MDRIDQLIRDRSAAEPEHADLWEQIGRNLRQIEGKPVARTGRTQCSMCQSSGDPWEFDDSGRCVVCAP